MEAQQLLNWFWSQFSKYYSSEKDRERICQCETEGLIERCDDPSRMRALLLIFVALDQAERSIQSIDHSTFHSFYRLPRLTSHADSIDPTEPSPDWVIYEYHGYHLKMDWNVAATIVETLIGDIHAWFNADPIYSKEWSSLTDRLRWLPKRISKYSEDAAARITKVLITFPT